MKGKYIVMLVIFSLSVQMVFATDYYWVRNGGNWKDSTHWSLTSGGVVSGLIPTIDDNVIFDANSFSLPGQIVIIPDDGSEVGGDFNTMDWRGVTNRPTFQIRITTSRWISNSVGGSIYFADNMILDFLAAEFYMASNSNYQFDTRGHYMGENCWLAFNLDTGKPGYAGANVTCTLLSPINHAWIYVRQGLLNANGNTIIPQTDGLVYNDVWLVGNPNPASLDISGTSMEVGNITIQNSSTIIDNNATITVKRAIQAAGQNFNRIITADSIVVSGSNTFETLELLPGSHLVTNATQTVNNFIANGTAASPIRLTGGTLSKTSGVLSAYEMRITNNIATGGAAFNAYSSTKTGNVTGWNFFSVTPSDSLALVALYNSTGGTGWTNKTNWLAPSKPVNTWFGVSRNSFNVTSINLPNNNVVGEVPNEVANLSKLQTLNLANNKITSIPDLSSLTDLTSVNVSGNALDFSSLEKNSLITGLNYGNQAGLGVDSESLADVGTDYPVTVSGGGISDQYQWKLNGIAVSGATSNVYTIQSINRSNMGDYTCEIINPKLPGLLLTTANQRVLATATLQGRLLVGDDKPATVGDMLLYKVKAGAFDTTATRSINPDGTYLFEKVILDDYQLLGYADTLAHKDALPTYYVETIFWEEADTLFVEDNLNDLDIVSVFKPAPPSTGIGEITGFFSEEGNTGGRTERNGRVKNSGASLSRIEKTNRPKDTELILVAYAFTNEDGEFVFSKLDPGVYRLNLQYPGFPMDATSFIDITIGTGLFNKQVAVEAQVVNNKIVVTKRIITGWEESEAPYSVYPNPVKEIIRIHNTSGSTQGLAIEFLNSNGQAIAVPLRYESGNDEWVLDVGKLTFGNYLIRVKEKNSTSVLRVVITD